MRGRPLVKTAKIHHSMPVGTSTVINAPRTRGPRKLRQPSRPLQSTVSDNGICGATAPASADFHARRILAQMAAPTSRAGMEISAMKIGRPCSRVSGMRADVLRLPSQKVASGENADAAAAPKKTTNHIATDKEISRSLRGVRSKASSSSVLWISSVIARDLCPNDCVSVADFEPEGFGSEHTNRWQLSGRGFLNHQKVGIGGGYRRTA